MHVVGQNLRSNPDDLLKAPDTVGLWDRYIVGGDSANSLAVERRRAVLRRLALFKRFGPRTVGGHRPTAIGATTTPPAKVGHFQLPEMGHLRLPLTYTGGSS